MLVVRLTDTTDLSWVSTITLTQYLIYQEFTPLHITVIQEINS